MEEKRNVCPCMQREGGYRLFIGDRKKSVNQRVHVWALLFNYGNATRDPDVGGFLNISG